MNHIFIIAEVGVNHNGSLELAKKMIGAAKDAGVDAVKFQTFVSENLVSCFAEKAEYQKAATGAAENQLEMIKKLELSYDDFRELKLYAAMLDIIFMSTPFDIDSIDLLAELGMDIFKIPSGEITNLPYLIRIGNLKRKVILSTGMSSLSDINEAVTILQNAGTDDITLLHCNTAYPTPYNDVNLNAMNTLRETFHLPVGYSDHTNGIEVPIAAAALGAVVIEKHFTLDRTMEGPDHKASLEPSELKQMVQAIRHIEQALGSSEKQPTGSELVNRDIARKSIVAKCGIKAGTVFTEDNITVKRPGNGISPMKWFEVLGQKASRDFIRDELIEL
ncbi:MAG: N-acetylneuraminate synthase [Methanocorpusculum sp.]|uniref:N-acetylneuraminate synthase n=1 Tax=Methanocorpusculum sp. TaxID=2058474 RepID=UPI00271692D7|nr:N-acetylneuraminate synthase [Methanocorpusculum sp.]MDO9523806.1 N-acetylneuraminate synthase [Methanocorpusculum sp.]